LWCCCEVRWLYVGVCVTFSVGGLRLMDPVMPCVMGSCLDAMFGERRGGGGDVVEKGLSHERCGATLFAKLFRFYPKWGKWSHNPKVPPLIFPHRNRPAPSRDDRQPRRGDDTEFCCQASLRIDIARLTCFQSGSVARCYNDINRIKCTSLDPRIYS
jgi:hypothetical protein